MRTVVRDQEQFIRMTQTPVPKLITKLAVPTVISMLVTAVYNTADTFFVAMLDDTAATGAVVENKFADFDFFQKRNGFGNGIMGQFNDRKIAAVGICKRKIAEVRPQISAEKNLFVFSFNNKRKTFIRSGHQVSGFDRTHFQGTIRKTIFHSGKVKIFSAFVAVDTDPGAQDIRRSGISKKIAGGNILIIFLSFHPQTDDFT